DFTHSKGLHLTRFLNVNRNNFFSPFLGEVQVTSAAGTSLYDRFTVGLRKRFSHGYQSEANDGPSTSKHDHPNKRDPLTDPPLSTPGLFNFDGFLRQGVGDPRQAQLAVKFEF